MPPSAAAARGGSLTSNPGVPSRSGAMSMPDAALTSNPGVTSRSGAMPAQGGALTSNPGVPSRSGAMAGQGGALTSNPGVASRSGALPAQGAALTSNPGVPSRSGALPAQGAALTSNPGVPSRSGAKVGEPGVVVSYSDASGGDADAEMPVLTPEQMGHGEPSERLEEMDTNPRASRPGRAERYEDTHPRAPRDADTDPRGPRLADMQARAAVHEDTQPRVVLDESLLRDVEGVARDDEERSGVSRPKTGSRRVRPSSPGMAPAQGRRTGVSRPVVVAVPAEEEEEDADVRVSMGSHEETRRTSVPSRPNIPVRRPSEDTRKTTVPKRGKRGSALKWVVVLGGLGALTAGGAFLMSDPQVRGMVTNQLEQLGLVAKKPEGTPSPSPVAPGAKAPVEGAAERKPGEGDAVVAEQAPVEAAPGAQAPEPAAVDAPPSAPAQDANAAKSVADDMGDDGLLAPLGTSASKAPKAPAPAPKRANTKRVRITKGVGPQTELTREWKAANAEFKRLEASRPCENLGLLCTKRNDLEGKVLTAEGEVDPELLQAVRNFRRQVQLQLESVEQ